jgi:hypothetical protein
LKGFVVEDDEAANFLGYFGAAEFRVHGLDQNLAT